MLASNLGWNTGCLLCLKANPGMVPCSGHDHFLPTPFKFIILTVDATECRYRDLRKVLPNLLHLFMTSNDAFIYSEYISSNDTFISVKLIGKDGYGGLVASFQISLGIFIWRPRKPTEKISQVSFFFG